MSSTRTPRRESDGKPLPAPPPADFFEEPTVADLVVPSDDELMEHLRQRAEYGQGDAGDDDRTFHRRVL